MFCKKGVLRNFAKLTEKHLCQSLFLIKLQASGQGLFLIKLQASGLQLYLKEALAQVLFCKFCEISKNTFSKEHLQTTASVMIMSKQCPKVTKVPRTKKKKLVSNLRKLTFSVVSKDSLFSAVLLLSFF